MNIYYVTNEEDGTFWGYAYAAIIIEENTEAAMGIAMQEFGIASIKEPREERKAWLEKNTKITLLGTADSLMKQGLFEAFYNGHGD